MRKLLSAPFVAECRKKPDETSSGFDVFGLIKKRKEERKTSRPNDHLSERFYPDLFRQATAS